MQIYTKEAKTKEEALKLLLEENNLTEDSIIESFSEYKAGLLKGTRVKIEAVTYDEIQKQIKHYLSQLLTHLGLEVSFETQLRNGEIIIKMYSNRNPLLIGKNGQTIKALETVCKQVIYKEIGVYPYLALDVADYRAHQISRLERLAQNMARKVIRTKKSIALEPMNSYNRRIIHNALGNYEKVYSESEGVEPNRRVVIKLRKPSE